MDATGTAAARIHAAALATLCALALAGCAAEPLAPECHDCPDLPRHEGKRVVLRSDLADPDAATAVERLDRMEDLLDRRFAWLQPAPGKVRVLLLADEARYATIARAHEVPGASAFSCLSGEVVVRWKPDEWGSEPSGGWVQAPRCAPVAEVLFRHRLEVGYGAALERTWLEDGCGRAFSELAARELGEAREAARRSRDDLVTAFLPLFLGGEPVFARTALARGNTAVAHGSEKSQRPAQARATAYACARFLLESDGGRRAAWIREALDAAAGRPGADKAWAAREADLHAAEHDFERWLRDATTGALLDALRDEPVTAARWEARSALRLIAAVDVDLDDGASARDRAATVERARAEVAKRGTVRFAEEFDGRLAELAGHHRPGGLERLVADARSELEERARGYGHPALEDGRAQLGRSLEARQHALSGAE